MHDFYFTFGQDHLHKVNNKIFDKDTVVKITANNSGDAREKMFKYFGAKWSFQYDSIEELDISLFPKGIIEI